MRGSFTIKRATRWDTLQLRGAGEQELSKKPDVFRKGRMFCLTEGSFRLMTRRS